MLQMEEEKALKKIGDTKKKTSEILTLKSKNDEKFQAKLQNENNAKGKMTSNANNNAETRQKRQMEIAERQNQLVMNKKNDVEQVKQLKQNLR